MATSQQVLDEMEASLISHAEVVDTERVYSRLEEFLKEGLIEYKNADVSDFSTLHVIERRLVVLLAWISVCYTRASAFAPQASQKPGSNVGYGFGTDRDTPYRKCMDLAAKLQEKYDALKAEYIKDYGDVDDNDDGSGDITVGSLTRHEEHLSVLVPYRQGNPVVILSFASLAAAAGEAILEWSKFSPLDFSEAFIFRSATAGIHQKWNNDGKDGIPFVSASASKVYSTTDNISKQVRFTGIASGTYYFLLVVKSVNDVYTYSEELTVIVT